MTNLIPEKRLDRNGKLVTRHIAASSQQGTERSPLPVPTLATDDSQKLIKKPLKLRPKQLEKINHVHDAAEHLLEERFVTDELREKLKNPAFPAFYTFEANEVEVYEVLSVAPEAISLLMLHEGVRTADEARAYLTERGAPDLILDRRNITDEALNKNVNHYAFIETLRGLTELGKASPHLVDMARFQDSSLYRGRNQMVLGDIAEGKVSFEDIQAIGFARFKHMDTVHNLAPALKKLHEGEGDYSVDGLKNLLDRAVAEKIEPLQFKHLCQAMDQIGLQETLRFQRLLSIATSYRDYAVSLGPDVFGGGAVDRAVYAAHFREGTNDQRSNGYVSNEFYEAGIPLDLAIDISRRGFGAREAQAIHHEGIEGSISGGWL